MQESAIGREGGRIPGQIQAIGLMALAVTLFAGLDAAGKYLASVMGVPVMQIMWLRFLGQFALILLLVPAFGILSAKGLFITRRPGLQLIRSLMMAATTGFNFVALKYLRLDQTISIIFLTPLVVALLAGPFLGEWVGWRRAVAILVGFAGILLVVRPGFADVHPAVLYSFAAMLAYAVFSLLTRHLVAYDPPLVTLFYSMFVGTLLPIPFVLDQWVAPPSALAWLLLLSLGILGGTGHYLYILAHRLAPASTVGPFIYLQAVSMTALGYIIFADVPDVWTIAGLCVVIASGIYLIHREHIVARQSQAKH
ncbi:MAG TPA: DMT family transporter [Hyphomicrobiaceae bacterium]|nr:DMT family transporter [Hyphomicrobiaceae bacterium]